MWLLKIATFFHLCYKRHFMFSKSCTCLFYAQTVLAVSKIDFGKHIFTSSKKKPTFFQKLKRTPEGVLFCIAFFIQSSGSI